MLAAILESGDPHRLYTALSLLVSAAADGEPARALVSFGALQPMLADDLRAGTDDFARSLAELRATATGLPGCRVWACAAAVDAAGLRAEDLGPHVEGVMSMPRFLRETAGARLVVV